MTTKHPFGLRLSAIVNNTHRIRRWTRRDFTGYQRLERVTKVLGLTVWIRVMDAEDVPSWVAIQRGALGYTDWESRLFAQHKNLLQPVERSA